MNKFSNVIMYQGRLLSVNEVIDELLKITYSQISHENKYAVRDLSKLYDLILFLAHTIKRYDILSGYFNKIDETKLTSLISTGVLRLTSSYRERIGIECCNSLYHRIYNHLENSNQNPKLLLRGLDKHKATKPILELLQENEVICDY